MKLIWVISETSDEYIGLSFTKEEDARTFVRKRPRKRGAPLRHKFYAPEITEVDVFESLQELEEYERR